MNQTQQPIEEQPISIASIATLSQSQKNTTFKEAMRILGDRILLSRRRLRLSQNELAEAANKSKFTSLTLNRISDIENAKTEASFLEIQAIADVLGKDLNEFRV